MNQLDKLKLIAAIFAAVISIAMVITFITLTAQAETVMTCTTVSDDLNVRREPSTRAPIVGLVAPGQTVIAEYNQKGWTHCKVSSEWGTGWLKTEYLTIDPELHGEYTNVSNGRVRIREYPDGKSRQRGWVPKGGKVNVSALAVDGNGVTWAYVGNGWVNFGMLEAVTG